MFNSSMLKTNDIIKIKNTNINEAIIDTYSVPDNKKGFETTVIHPFYNDGKLIIVEEYNSKKEAIVGHDKWFKIFRIEPPKELKDVPSNSVFQMIKPVVVPKKVVEEIKEESVKKKVVPKMSTEKKIGSKKKSINK